MSQLLQSLIDYPYKDFYNDYEIIKTLNRGRKSHVLVVKNKKSKQLCVLKIYFDLENIHQIDLIQILNEVFSLKDMSVSDPAENITNVLQTSLDLPFTNECNKNVICYYDTFMFDYELIRGANLNSLGILMEYFPSFTLNDLIECKKKSGYIIPPSIIRKFMTVLFSTLAYIHNVIKIAHRDIKPVNILYDRKLLKLADFGFACRTSSQPERDVFICPINESAGSIAFMAPEVEKDKLKSPEEWKISDVWSMGAVMFYVVMGEYPYYPYTKNGRLKTTGRDDRADLSYPDPVVVEILNRTLDKDPKTRSTAQEVVNLLENNPI